MTSGSGQPLHDRLWFRPLQSRTAGSCANGGPNAERHAATGKVHNDELTLPSWLSGWVQHPQGRRATVSAYMVRLTPWTFPDVSNTSRVQLRRSEMNSITNGYWRERASVSMSCMRLCPKAAASAETFM